MQVYKLRVLLDDKEVIYRDILIESKDNLESLHYAILDAFDLSNSEPASFYTSDNSWERLEEIPIVAFDESMQRQMNTTLLQDVLSQAGDKLIYIYDFLNEWYFFIELVDVLPYNKTAAYPLLVDSYGNSPDEQKRKKAILDDSLEDDSPKKNALFDDDIFEDFDDFENFEDYDF
jgi:hypothetical protein